MSYNDHINQPPSPPHDLSASGLTIPSDSEPYSSISPPSSSPPQSSNNNGERPVIIYQPPTFWSLLRGAAINLLLPFVNGMMLGFGELFAHEWAFRLGWSQTNVRIFELCQTKANKNRYFLRIVTLESLVLEWKCETIQQKEDEGTNR